jgi:uroporphyrin-III C-methyltransferase
VEVVNGITAGLAAATALGVPLTHREHAQGVVFLTGHPRRGAEPPDWKSLAAAARDARLTLVIYMGVASARRIQDDLLTALPPHTPVAVVQRASLPGQRHVVATLANLADTIARAGLGSPSVIVVGDVVRGLAAAAAPSRARSA